MYTAVQKYSYTTATSIFQCHEITLTFDLIIPVFAGMSDQSSENSSSTPLSPSSTSPSWPAPAPPSASAPLVLVLVLVLSLSLVVADSFAPEAGAEAPPPLLSPFRRFRFFPPAAIIISDDEGSRRFRRETGWAFENRWCRLLLPPLQEEGMLLLEAT